MLMKTPEQTEESRWQAVLRRDAAADGSFWYAVRSTGVYCRPACPSRRPGRENVTFYESPVAAEQAGYRPCRRCRPGEATAEQQVVVQVRQLIETSDTLPTLADLGEAAGLSPSHLQRLFKRATGLSPRQYAAAWRAERLKDGLRGGATVTDALYQAGYGSSRALYEAAPQHLGMSPRAYRSGGAGEQIAYACADTPLGTVLVAATARGVCALRFGDEAALVAELQSEFPRADLVCSPEQVEPYVAAVRAHLAGDPAALDLPLDVRGTAFQQRVWAALQSIPAGEVRSYGAVAEFIGEPRAVRAVARACATNPVALAIPCHRVVRASGDLSGYRWGVERKEALLARERSRAASQAAKARKP